MNFLKEMILVMEKIYLKAKKKSAPAFVPFICALMYVLVGVSIIIGIINKNYLLWGSLSGFTILILFIISKSFSWYLFAELESQKNELKYTVTDIINSLGNDKTIYTIYGVEDFDIKGSNIHIKGMITKKEPLRKEKSVNKVVIYDIPDDKIKIVKKEIKSLICE